MKKRIALTLSSLVLSSLMITGFGFNKEVTTTKADNMVSRYSQVQLLSEDNIITADSMGSDQESVSTEDNKNQTIIDETSTNTISKGKETPKIENKKVTPKAENKKIENIKIVKTAAQKKAEKRQEISKYALKFVGNPYRYGGTSLTNGTDCSGFTYSVYKNFGYSLGRSSRDQVNNGKRISLKSVQPGDLVFYARGGRISHVAMYIGNGKIVHASTYKTGIKISNMYYSTPYKAVSIL